MKQTIRIILFILFSLLNIAGISVLMIIQPQPWVSPEYLDIITNLEIFIYFLLFILIEYRLFKKVFRKNFTLKKAIEIAKNAHKEQVDKAGKLYIEHPLYIMNQLRGREEKIAGILHDVVEDSNMTFEDLRKVGCPVKIITALKLVTHPKDYKGTEDEYMNGIRAIANSGNQIAIDLKFVDLTHNSDLSRLPKPTEKDLARVEKYRKSMEILKPLVSSYLKT